MPFWRLALLDDGGEGGEGGGGTGASDSPQEQKPTQKNEGKPTDKVDDPGQESDVERIKRALEAERAEHKKTTQKLREATGQQKTDAEKVRDLSIRDLMNMALDDEVEALSEKGEFTVSRKAVRDLLADFNLTEENVAEKVKKAVTMLQKPATAKTPENKQQRTDTPGETKFDPKKPPSLDLVFKKQD